MGKLWCAFAERLPRSGQLVALVLLAKIKMLHSESASVRAQHQ